jgi:hypothetical protein
MPGDAGCASPFLVVVSQHEFFFTFYKFCHYLHRCF